MPDTQYVPWWVKAPLTLQYGIVGVPALIAIGSVVALWAISSKQFDMMQKGQVLVEIGQEQTREALDLYKKSSDVSNAQAEALRAIADKITGLAGHITGQHDKLIKMELFTCKTAARNPTMSEQCSSYMRDLDEHLVNDNYSLLNGVTVNGRRITTDVGRSYKSSNTELETGRR